ncbi:kinase-like domain-containing protein [Truncatella angustata]|uniref:Kinase-like domain-containing protein n=1 Tax=Truncatella angustata TaxID=152316 RepID=A0A9P8ZWS8_9PEZI|nr:kinase-like domain-containing protein [Truncatella angustata]KAH6652412.1 kinase-like domain-containing protein [Truncatella angustata]
MTPNPPVPSALHPQFRTHIRTPTIAASPQQVADLSSEAPPESHDDKSGESLFSNQTNCRSSLRITTDIQSTSPARNASHNACHSGHNSLAPSGGQLPVERRRSSSLRPIQRTPSLKQAIANSIGSACSSAVPSPLITAMGDITPLPSPLLMSDSPGPWRRLGMRPPSREAPPILPSMMPGSALVTANGESVSSALANQSKRKTYVGLKGSDAPPGPEHRAEHTHGRNRSVSEYVPDPLAIPKRQSTVSGSHPRAEIGVVGTDDKHMRRERHLGPTRGLVPSHKPPTPPPSESSQSTDGSTGQLRKPKAEYFEAYGRHDKKLRRWRAVKQLGEGTFSRVVLATSHVHTDDNETPKTLVESEPDPKSLVAVKVCEHGPRGGASEDRIEMSLKRELEIMQTLHHPSLVHLKAWNIEQTRALLVISYCPGGDLFDLAARHKELLTPPLLRRIFAELVGAVQYLHERRIVHRDIKLENVLVNVPIHQLADPKQDWATYPDSVITLTDLGLSRRVADDEKLETRCGSDDYAAPEVILGQPYDGKAIDAWSMGVLLYALLESRLPFDPPPGAPDALRMRSRTSHRIARIEWRWIEYAGDDGDHECDEAKFEAKGLTGAMEVTEGLLKRARSRWTLEKVAETEWVRGGIKVEGGPKFKEEEEGEEVL